MTQKFFSSLRGRATFTLTGIFMVMGLACVLIVGMIITDRLDGFEHDLAASNVRRARNALQQDMKRLDDLLKDWAWWDDAYEFMDSGSQDFLDSNVTPDVFSNQGIDAMFFIAPDGQVRHAVQVSAESGELGSPVPGLLAYAVKSTVSFPVDDLTGIQPELVHIEGSLWIAASKPVLDSMAEGPARGRLWMVKTIDERYVQALTQRTELDLRICAAVPRLLPHAMLGLADLDSDMSRALVVSEDTSIWSGLLLPDAAGGRPVAIIARSPRELAAFARATMETSLAVVVLFGVVGFFGGLAFLDRLVLSRLSALSRRVMSDAPEASVCTLGSRCDEIDQLSMLMDTAFGAIRDNERFLSEILGALKVGVVLIRKGDGRIVSANPYACLLLGRQQRETVGADCRDVMCRNEREQCLSCDLDSDADNQRGILVGKGGEKIDILRSATTIMRDGQEFLLETFLDIREIEHTRHLLEQSEERYRAIFMNTGTPGILINEDTSIAVANREFLLLTKCSAADLAGHPSWTRFFTDDDSRRMLPLHVQRRRDEEAVPRSYETRLVDAQGEIHYVRITVAMIPRTQQSIAFMSDITDIRRAEGKLQELAYTDSLTGLPNRLSALERLDRALAAARVSGESLAVLLLDIDDFKIVNDSWGHAAGDVMLMEVGERLASVLSEREMVGRLGGDEFIVVSPGSSDESAYARLAQKLIDTLSRPFRAENAEFHLGVSVGIALSPRDGDTAGQLVRCADLAMYQSKSEGKSTFQFHSPALTQHIQRRMEIERELRLALDAGEIVAFYQPIVDLGTGLIIGAEALARWRRSDGSLIPPVEFIPVAEQTNLITEIDLSVMWQACRQARAWGEEGLGSLRIACNISARHFQRGDLLGEVAAVLADSMLPPGQLSLEVTETVYMENIDKARSILDALGRLGVKSALDDFGTGYSSLSYVRSLAFDVMKIDKSFVHNLPEESSLALVRAMLGIADSLGITPLAEGLETPEQLELLKSLGCRFGQGYLFSPPVPAERFVELLKGQNRPG